MQNQKINNLFIQEVVELTSINFAQKLVDRFRGQRLYIPWKAPHNKHELSQVFNKEEMEVLIENFAGNTLEIPMSLTKEAPIRKAKILELKSKNYRIRDIAKLTGCSWRWVQKVLSREKERQELAKKQGNLF